LTKFIPAAHIHACTPLFDFLCNVVGLGKKYRQAIIQSLALPDRDLRIMDAGCGTGTLALDLKSSAPRIDLYAVDADDTILAGAQKKSNKKKIKIHFKHPIPPVSFTGGS
jgi:ubiquinone/menaquinone biosynthesis C-methylase UbiE